MKFQETILSPVYLLVGTFILQWQIIEKAHLISWIMARHLQFSAFFSQGCSVLI